MGLSNKQNWIQITKEQIKSIPVGSPIRVAGVETVLTSHYSAPSDYGFDLRDVIPELYCMTFGSLHWNKNIKVEVLMDQGHPHAESMALYAEDAKTTDKPWELWQIKDCFGNWNNTVANPVWLAHAEYRRKPATKRIHGVEVPDISFTPEDNEYYFYPDPTKPCMYEMEYFHKYAEECEHRLTNKMCYPTTDEGREAAILYAKAMLGIK